MFETLLFLYVSIYVVNWCPNESIVMVIDSIDRLILAWKRFRQVLTYKRMYIVSRDLSYYSYREDQ